MITLRRLALKNFLSHEETVIDFWDQEKLLIDGNSGSGKSAIIEALIWALYGKARVDNRYLVRRGESKCVVELKVWDGHPDHGGWEYDIIRTANTKGGHTIEVLKTQHSVALQEHIDRAGIRDIQDWIENELLHASYLLFVNSIAYVQDNSDTFVKQTAAKRKELLLEIVRANQYADLYKKASDHLTSELGEEIKITSKVDSLNESAARLNAIFSQLGDHALRAQQLEADLSRVTAEISSLEKEQDKFKGVSKEIDTTQNTIRLLRSSIEKNNSRLKSNSDAVLDYSKRNQDLSKKELEVEAIGDVASKIESLASKIEKDNNRTMKLSYAISSRIRPVNYASQIAEIDKQIKPLSDEAGKCPSGDQCPLGQPMRAQIAFLESEKVKRQELAMEQEKTLLEQENNEKELSVPLITPEEREEYKTYLELAKKKEDLKKDIDIIKIVLSGIDVTKLSNEALQISTETSALVKDLEEEEKKLEKLVSELGSYDSDGIAKKLTTLASASIVLGSDLRNAQGDIRTSQNAANELLGISEQLKDLEAARAAIRENIEALVAVKEAFSQKGVPAVVVDYMVPKLEENINLILSQLSDFRMRIDTQRKNASGDGMTEGLFLTIYNEHGEEFDFDSYSGGQKLKITVAISEALASLQRVGFRIMDETFTALDEESTDEFVEVMEKLQARFNQIICITHLRHIKDLFEKKITVTRANGLSTIN